MPWAEGVGVVGEQGIVEDSFSRAYNSKKIQGLIKRNAVLWKQKNGLDFEDNVQIAWEQVWKICEKFDGSRDENRLLAYLNVAVPRKLGRIKKILSEELLIDIDSISSVSHSPETLHLTAISVRRFQLAMEESGLKTYLEVLTGEVAVIQRDTSDDSCAKFLKLGRSTFQRKKSFLRSKLKDALGC
jgi:hypothetical protein